MTSELEWEKDGDRLPIEYLIAGLKSVWRFKWLIFLASLLTSVAAYFASDYWPERYASTVTLSIQGAVGEDSPWAANTEAGMLDKTFLNTQFEFLVSRDHAERVASDYTSVAHACIDFTNIEADSAKQHRKAVASVLQNVEVVPVRNTALFRITARCMSADSAQSLAQNFTQSFIEKNHEEFSSGKSDATEWLRERMSILNDKVVEAERELQAFKEREDVYSSQLGESVAGIEIARLLEAYGEAQEKRAELAALYEQIEGLKQNFDLQDILSITEVREDPVVSQMLRELTSVSAHLNSMKEMYTAEHPEVALEQIRYDKLVEQMKEQLQVVAQGVGKRLQAVQRSVSNLQTDIEQLKSKSIKADRKVAILAQLERKVEVNRELYRDFMMKVNDPVVSQGYVGDRFKIVGEAYRPEKPYTPRKKVIAVLGFSGMFTLLSGVFFFRRPKEELFSAPLDVSEKLGVRLLGAVPAVKSNSSSFAFDGYMRSTQAQFTDAIRGVRTGLNVLQTRDKNKITVVTSSIPNEGKSTIALNLAAAFGQLQNVLLIDADVNNPMLGQSLGVNGNARGLMNVLCGNADIPECVIPGGSKGFDFMPVGRVSAQFYNASNIPRDPLELLSLPIYESLINKLKSDYEHIIIDSGPVCGASATQVVCAHSTHVCYVVAAIQTHTGIVKRGLQEVKSWNANLAGVILNKVDYQKMERSDYTAYAPGTYAVEAKTRSVIRQT